MTEVAENGNLDVKKDFSCQIGESTEYSSKQNALWSKESLFDTSMKDFEERMKHSLVGKMMSTFEETMNNETRKFNEIRNQVNIDENKIVSEKHTDDIPIPMKSGDDLEFLWNRIHQILMARSVKSISKVSMKQLTPELYQLLLGHGMGAWIATLSTDHYEYLVSNIYDEVSSWIAKIWRFKYSGICYHYEAYEGLLKVCKAALCDKYPKYQTDGFNAFYSKLPILYFNQSVGLDVVEYIRISLGLPQESVSIVLNDFEHDRSDAMNTEHLERTILYDMSNGKMPLLVHTHIGSRVTGSIDDLKKINAICRSYSIWLHVEGMKLSHLVLNNCPVSLTHVSNYVHSVTLHIAGWLCLPAVPYITMVSGEIPRQSLRHIGFNNRHGLHTNSHVSVFPIWLGLQVMGYEGIVQKVEHKVNMCSHLHKSLKKIPFLRLIERETSNPESVEGSPIHDSNHSMKSMVDSMLTFILDGAQIPLVSIFRFDFEIQPEIIACLPDKDSDSMNDSDNNERMEDNFINNRGIKHRKYNPGSNFNVYINSLNTWLGVALKTEFPIFDIRTINLPSIGTCIRLCIHENINSDNITPTDVDRLIELLTTNLKVMNTTVQQRKIFYQKVQQTKNLLFNDLPTWAGLGSVIYVPEIYLERMREIFPDRCFQYENIEFLKFVNVNPTLNEFNKSLASELRAEDDAFSLGCYDIDVRYDTSGNSRDNNSPSENGDDNDETSTRPNQIINLFCVRFGLITDESLVDKLISLVIKKAQMVEENIQDFVKFTELIKNSINKINKEMQLEYETRIKQQGLLRQVPYLDSLINWISPAEKTSTIGRSLYLPSGQLRPTEDTYKYKMQLVVSNDCLQNKSQKDEHSH